jgi:hypothetical protein
LAKGQDIVSHFCNTGLGLTRVCVVRLAKGKTLLLGPLIVFAFIVSDFRYMPCGRM